MSSSFGQVQFILPSYNYFLQNLTRTFGKAKFYKIKTQGINPRPSCVNSKHCWSGFPDVNSFARLLCTFVFCTCRWLEFSVEYINFSRHCSMVPLISWFISFKLVSMACNDHCDLVNDKIISVYHSRLATCSTCHQRSSVRLQKTWIQLNHYM